MIRFSPIVKLNLLTYNVPKFLFHHFANFSYCLINQSQLTVVCFDFVPSKTETYAYGRSSTCHEIVISDEQGQRIATARITNMLLGRPVDRLPWATRLDIWHTSRVRSGTLPAELAGLDLIEGRIHGDTLTTPSGISVTGTAGISAGMESAGVAVFTPSAVAIHLREPEGSPRNVFPVTIGELEARGPVIRVRGETDSRLDLSADVTAASVAALDLVPGMRAYFVVKATEVALHPAH